MVNAVCHLSQTKIIMLIIQEVVQSSCSEVMSDLQHQYGIFQLKLQTLLSGDAGGTQHEAAAFTG